MDDGLGNTGDILDCEWANIQTPVDGPENFYPYTVPEYTVTVAVEVLQKVNQLLYEIQSPKITYNPNELQMFRDSVQFCIDKAKEANKILETISGVIIRV